MSASENLLAFDLGMIGGMTGRVWGGAAMEARNMFGAPGGSVCFVAGTQVAVAGDSSTITGKAIEDIKLGDWVWSRNDETGEEGYKPVVHLFRNTTEELAHLTYTSGTGLPTREGTLTGTPGHKFWSETRQAGTPMVERQASETLLPSTCLLPIQHFQASVAGRH